MFKIRATAPTRVDLAGGTIDLWPIHNLLNRKATVNVAIDLYAQAEVFPSTDRLFHFESVDQNMTVTGDFPTVVKSAVMPLFGYILETFWHSDLPSIVIKTTAKSPAGAGLGGSSCLAVAVARAVAEARKTIEPFFSVPDEVTLVRTVQDIESRVIFAPTGIQDYWGGVRGGINLIHYQYGKTLVTTLPGEILRQQDFTILCCYSGKSRASAINNWEIFKRIFDGDQDLLIKMRTIGDLAYQCSTAIATGDWTSALQASRDEWEVRKILWPKIETEETRQIDMAAISSGAKFSRVCGAGGGGVMAIICPRDKIDSVSSAVKKVVKNIGGDVLDVKLGGHGLRVEIN